MLHFIICSMFNYFVRPSSNLTVNTLLIINHRGHDVCHDNHDVVTLNQTHRRSFSATSLNRPLGIQKVRAFEFFMAFGTMKVVRSSS
jgi:hypothetical protein